MWRRLIAVSAATAAIIGGVNVPANANTGTDKIVIKPVINPLGPNRLSRTPVHYGHVATAPKHLTLVSAPKHLTAPKHLSAPKHLAAPFVAVTYTTHYTAFWGCDINSSTRYWVAIQVRATGAGYQPNAMTYKTQSGTPPMVNAYHLEWYNANKTYLQSRDYGFTRHLPPYTVVTGDYAAFTVIPKGYFRVILKLDGTNLCDTGVVPWT